LLSGNIGHNIHFLALVGPLAISKNTMEVSFIRYHNLTSIYLLSFMDFVINYKKLCRYIIIIRYISIYSVNRVNVCGFAHTYILRKTLETRISNRFTYLE